MNGSQGIVPTVDLATNNNGYAYPVYPMGYGNNGFGGFGGDGIWGLLALALIFGNNGWGGFGNNGVGNQVATTDFVATQNVQNRLGDLSTQLCGCCSDINSNVSNGFYNTATNMCNLRSDVLTGNMALSNQILDSKYANALGDCNTQRDILIQTTQLENQLGMTSLQGLARLDSCCCDIKNAIREDGEQTRALITQNTIQDLRDRLTAAKDIISDREQTDTILSRLQPTPIPSYVVTSPYQSIFTPTFGFNNGCGCNNGCGNNNFLY